jgi:membrane-associated phospholipid phosphatase
VNSVIVFAAQYLIYLLVAAAALVWFLGDIRDKTIRAAEAALGLAFVGLGLLVAGHLHTDPRPFVHDPNSTPLLPHAADNGFPSDHSAAAGLLAGLVLRWRQLIGVAVAAGAVVVAWGRVAAHVHHAQDVLAGLVIGGAAAGLGIWVFGRLLAVLRRRGVLTVTGPAPPPTASAEPSSDLPTSASRSSRRGSRGCRDAPGGTKSALPRAEKTRRIRRCSTGARGSQEG